MNAKVVTVNERRLLNMNSEIAASVAVICFMLHNNLSGLISHWGKVM